MLSVTMQKFWTKFENHSSTKYSPILNFFLKKCGIDRTSFSDITEDTIKQIEIEINKDKSILKKSVYDETKEFKLSIGHRLSLINIPEKYRKFCEYEKENKKTRRIFLSLLKETICCEDNDDPDSEPDQVIKLLLTKLNRVAKEKFEEKYIIDKSHLKKIRIKSNNAHCSVQCPFCEVKIPCIFKSYWIVSNFTKHVSSHLTQTQNQAKIPIEIQTPIISNNSCENLKYQRANHSVSIVVHQMLRLVKS